MLHALGTWLAGYDLKLVALSACVCVFAVVTAGSMLLRDDNQNTSRGMLWSGGAGFAFGSGVWSTHFIALLAYQSGMPVSYRLNETAISLLIAIAGSVAGMRVLSRATAHGRLLAGGALLGLTIGAMHYTGMQALNFAGTLRYDLPMVFVSLVLGVLIAAAAAVCFGGRRLIAAAALLTLAVVILHFASMAATGMESMPMDPAAEGALPPGPFALAVAAWSLMILALSFAGALMDRTLAGRLAVEARRFRLFADGTFEGIFFHRDELITDANAALGRLLGADPARLIGRPIIDLFPPDQRPRAVLLCGNEAVTNHEIDLQTAGHGRIAVELLGRVSPGEGGMVAVRDVRERRAAQESIRMLAQSDSLTGLANRSVFLERLRESAMMAQHAGHGFAVLCIDLDRFKAVNDTLGHPGGDALLIAVGERLSACVRPTDLVARFGGDEFAIIQQSDAQPSGATTLARRVVDSLGAPFSVLGQTVTIGASVGIALAPRDGAGHEALLRNADLAMYHAKNAGRGGLRLFAAGMDQQVQQRRQLEQDLRAALTGGALELHYQPICDAATLRVVGREALLRWHDPVRGQVSPAEMIPAAEDSGLIEELGLWVIETACREAAQWTEPLFVAVNLSARQLRADNLADQLDAILRQTGLAPERLELEVTESCMIEDRERALAILSAIKARGVSLALDDFGAGYSSIAHLRQFPFDTVKIDRSFVSALDEGPGASAVIGSIVALGNSLRLSVTIEGVETGRQLQTLQTKGCARLQGFLLGRPASLSPTTAPAENCLA